MYIAIQVREINSRCKCIPILTYIIIEQLPKEQDTVSYLKSAVSIKFVLASATSNTKISLLQFTQNLFIQSTITPAHWRKIKHLIMRS